MTNPYFTPTPFVRHTKARAEAVSNEFDAVEAAFDLLPEPDVLTSNLATYGTESGAGNAYVVTKTTPYLSYVTGQEIVFLVSRANTGAATVNIDGLGARAIKRSDNTDLIADDLAAGSIVALRFNGTAFNITSAVRNDVVAAAASASAASASETAAGLSEAAAAASETAAGLSETAAAASEGTATTKAAEAVVSAGTATTKAAEAVVSAGTASTKAAEAVASASAASGSETAAGLSETAAAASEAAAGLSETAASASETAAAASETAAAASALAADGSDTSAAASAGTATTKAAEAVVSAGTATTKAAEAVVSAGTATTKASEAAASALAASNSETAAGLSETAAAASETAAGVSETNAAASLSSMQAVYLGAQASDPSLDLNGDALAAGMWYYNTTATEPRIYNGSAFVAAALSVDEAFGTSAFLDVAAAGDAAAGEVVKGNDSRLSDARTPTSHGHAIADITSLQATLNAKQALSAKGAVNGYAGLDAGSKVPTAQLPSSTSAQLATLVGAAPITPTNVSGLLAYDTPSGASNYAPPFATKRRANWVITAARVLSNPTGGVPGATFEVTIESSSATEHAVTFGTNYKGTLPTVAVTNAAFVTLFIYCISSTEFLVSDKEW